MNGLLLIRTAGLGIATLLLQFLLFDRLPVFGARPDLVLIFIIWFAGFLDKTSCLIVGFVISFAADALMDQWGLHMVSNTLLVLIGYAVLAQTSHRKWVGWQLFAAFLAISVVKNLILIGVGSTVDIYALSGRSGWRILAGGSIYTAMIGTLANLFDGDR